MNIIFWIVFVVTVLEFVASPVNTLLNSKMHIQRLREVDFSITFAKILAVIELIAVITLIAGLWNPLLRHIGGSVLAICFVPILAWAIRARRPAGDLLGLGFFMACALLVAFLPY